MKFLGKKLKFYVFGSSHSKKITCSVKGLPKFVFSLKKLSEFIDRRNIGLDHRHEKNEIIFISGLKNGSIIDDLVTFYVENNDVKQDDYDNLKYIPRPSHADFSAYLKFGLDYDMAGGGKFSGRMTVILLVIGGILKQYLEIFGIKIYSHIYKILDIFDISFENIFSENDPIFKKLEALITNKELPVYLDSTREKIIKKVFETKNEKNSLGGACEVFATTPFGIGDAFFDGFEPNLSYILFSIPSVKAVEFGKGTNVSSMKGSENNDEFYISGNKILTKTNNAGGVLGGITTGMPVLAKVHFKPPSSIGIVQNTVNLKKFENCKIKIKGRHDTTILFKAVPLTEALFAIGIYDLINF